MASRLANPLTIPAEDEFDLFEVMFALTDPIRRAIVSSSPRSPEERAAALTSESRNRR